VHDNMPIFTVDSRKDMQHLRYIPESFGEDRHRVGWIRCVYGEAADAFMANTDLSNMTIVGGDHATVDTDTLFDSRSASAVVRKSPENTLAVRSSTAVTPWAPVSKNPQSAGSLIDILFVCHDINQNGSCMHIDGTNICYLNPFNVDRINSMTIGYGYRCTFYLEGNCQAKTTVPHYEEARTGNKVMNTIPYDIVSLSCIPIPFAGN